MPTTQSKEAGKDEKNKQIQLRLLNIHMLSNIALSLFTFSSRTTLLQQLVKNDSARMVNILSTWASTIGAAEFLLNPTMGRLSDYYGRKTFMLMSPVACVILKTINFFYFRPTNQVQDMMCISGLEKIQPR